MRGHENVIKLRMTGKRPQSIFVNDWDCQTDPRETGRMDVVNCAGDVIELQDWRFLVGMTVSCSSPSEDRAKALFEACKAAGATLVGSVHSIPDGPYRQKSGWCAVWRKEDGNAAH